VQQAKEVTLHTHAKNKYGRTLADVLFAPSMRAIETPRPYPVVYSVREWEEKKF
jgi:hypothetical protein